MRLLLFSAMFLAIYAPKIGGHIDMLSITCASLILISLCTTSYRYLYNTTKNRITVYCLFFILMAGYTSALLYFHNFDDLYQPMRFLRATINSLGIISLISLYYRFLKTDSLETIIFHTWLCIIVHAFIITLMFLNPSFNTLIVDHIVMVNTESDNYEARINAKRIGGLTSSWDATSAIHATGILLIPIISSIKNTIKSRILIYCTIPFSLLAMSLSGVTGFVTLVLVGILTLFSGRSIKKLIQISISLVIVFMIFIGALSLLSKHAPAELNDSSIYRTIFMITGDEHIDYARSKRAPTASETVSGILNNMYFAPDNVIDFLFGLGGSGRSESNYIIEADPGPTLNLHNIGFIASFALYLMISISFLHAFSIRKNHRNLSNFVIIIIGTIIIVDCKVQYLLARNSLSFMMIALGIFWQYQGHIKTMKKLKVGKNG